MTSIIVTNDDGFNAPGILALAEAMQTIGKVEVAAPGTNQSASGHKKTLFQDIEYIATTIGDGIPTLAVYGSPADCIAVSALGLVVDWAPDIVVSGINRGENMGQDLTYSGTVTAALEASIQGIPAIAVSMSNHLANDVEDYRLAAQITIPIVQKVLENGLPPFTILNVNVPAVKNINEIRGMRLTRQGVRVYLDTIEQDGKCVRIVGDPPIGKYEDIGTDIWAVYNNYVSITPVHLDMTAHRLLADLTAWDIQIK